MGSNEFLVVANRLPVDKVGDHYEVSPGGLVAALAPVLRSRGGCWVGWPGDTSAELEPFEFNGISLVPVCLDQDDFEGFYEGFSNSTLWPLYHDLIVTPEYRQEWWERYVAVNEKFARATAKAAGKNATVWVQDYQLQLVPGMLRELRPDLTIGFFLHIPFPAPALFQQLPWRDEILSGLSGCDLIGFQRTTDEENFRLLTTDIRTGTFPISIDADEVQAATESSIRTLRNSLGNPKHVLLGVDRMDYTKGILQRLLAVEELLEEGELDDIAVVQLATPSRERIEHYRKTRTEVEQAIGRINGRFGQVGRPVVHYIHRGVSKDKLGTFYAAADIMLVTPFKDGMNLVAKEYVAAHPKGDGALVLSEFAGAAVELNQAYLCNPFDLGSIKAAIVAATNPDPARMRAMHDWVMEHDVTRWAQDFLEAL